MELDLDDGHDDRQCSNEELLQNGYEGETSVALIERMADYGRYLLICSARGGGLPPNLQGIWNGDWSPPWCAMYTNNENIEMAYWQALPGNLLETTEAFFEFYEAYTDDYQHNARSVYGCRGFFVPHAQTPAHAQPRSSAPHCIYWVGGAGWLSALFYDHYLFTGDRAFLEHRAVPFMEQAALFYEDFLTEDEDGRCHFAPSYSPENSPALAGRETDMQGMFACTVNATMDIAIARELLSNLCDACDLLGIKSEDAGRWRQLLRKLPGYDINEDGAIREWVHPDLLDNYHHRHQSHLYPVFPGLEVTRESDPNLARACSIALDKRMTIGLGSQTGWSLAHTANSRARLEEGDAALAALETLIQSCVRPNLFTHHNDWRRMGVTMDAGDSGGSVFQMDANFGVSAAVLDIGWDMETAAIDATLCSQVDQTVTVKFPGAVSSVGCDTDEVDLSPAPEGKAYRKLALTAGKRVVLSCSLPDYFSNCRLPTSATS
jgi:alpha-L-fucosidase 2